MAFHSYREEQKKILPASPARTTSLRAKAVWRATLFSPGGVTFDGSIHTTFTPFHGRENSPGILMRTEDRQLPPVDGVKRAGAARPAGS